MKGLGVGRIVHYVDVNGDHLAAIVTEIIDPEEGRVNLSVFNVMVGSPPIERLRRVPHSVEGQMVYSWHWPEYVP